MTFVVAQVTAVPGIVESLQGALVSGYKARLERSLSHLPPDYPQCAGHRPPSPLSNRAMSLSLVRPPAGRIRVDKALVYQVEGAVECRQLGQDPHDAGGNIPQD